MAPSLNLFAPFLPSILPPFLPPACASVFPPRRASPRAGPAAFAQPQRRQPGGAVRPKGEVATPAGSWSGRAGDARPLHARLAASAPGQGRSLGPAPRATGRRAAGLQPVVPTTQGKGPGAYRPPKPVGSRAGDWRGPQILALHARCRQGPNSRVP